MNAHVDDEGRVPAVPRLNELGKPPSQKPNAPAKAASATWLVAALLVLSVVPLAAGAFRLTELAGGAAITPANARFFASPLPVVLHIVSAGVYAILGAFQFAPGFRRRRPGWHRAAGRLLVACGLLVGLSALWMTLFYPRTGELLYALRLLFGSAMVMSIVLGFAAIRRGDVMRHRAWMTRGYALGLGAGTQVLTLAAGEVIAGPTGELSRALLMGAAWVINLAVAEWAIRKRPAPPARRAAAGVALLHRGQPAAAPDRAPQSVVLKRECMRSAMREAHAPATDRQTVRTRRHEIVMIPKHTDTAAVQAVEKLPQHRRRIVIALALAAVAPPGPPLLSTMVTLDTWVYSVKTCQAHAATTDSAANRLS